MTETQYVNRGLRLLFRTHNLPPPAFDLRAPWSRSEAEWLCQAGTAANLLRVPGLPRRRGLGWWGIPPYRLLPTRSAALSDFADVECFIKCFSPVEAVALSSVEAFIIPSVEAFNSPLEVRRRCHVSLL